MVPEIENYLQRIENLRGQIIDLVGALPAEALNWRPIEAVEDHAMNSLAVMATHVAGAEHYWIAEVIGGYPATRNREAEFVTEATDSTELRRRLEKAGQETRDVLSKLSPADLESAREANGRTVPVRWALVHVIDHTALHLGHMQITSQLWQGGRSAKSPRWFERLPRKD
jgi:uncharacterized damage-inducible protein DinB